MNLSSNEFENLYNDAEPSKIPEKKLGDTIKNLLPPADKINNPVKRSDVCKLYKVLYYKSQIEDEKYLEICYALRNIDSNIGSANRTFPPLSDKDFWNAALAASKNFKLPDEFNIQVDFQDERVRVYVAKKLSKDYGAIIQVSDDGLEITNVDVLYEAIEDRITQIGGGPFIGYLLTKANYVPVVGRFIPIRDRGQGHWPDMKLEDYEPDIPFNHLLNLGYKHFSAPRQLHPDFVEIADEAIEIARNLCLIQYPVQSFNGALSHLGGTNRSLNEMLYNAVMSDSIFNLPQYRLPFVIELMDFFTPQFKSKYNSMDGYGFEDLKAIFDFVVSNADTQRFSAFKAENCYFIKDKAKLDALLSDLSFDTKELNATYTEPHDMTNMNAWRKPLIKDGDTYYFPPASIGAFAFFEVLQSKVRLIDPKNIEKVEGFMLEDFVISLMSRKNITSKSGKYKNGDQEFECDFVVETIKSLMFMELKKKPLTNKAKSGLTDEIIIDLANSQVDSLFQCMRHIAFLKSNKSLTLNEETTGATHTITFNNQDITPVSLVLNSFGLLTDRFISKQNMEAFLRSEFFVDTKAFPNPKDLTRVTDKIKNLNKKLKLINDYLFEIDAITKGSHELFNMRFVSLEQLSFMISQSHDNASFFDTFNVQKYVSTGSDDFYFDYYYSKLLSK